METSDDEQTTSIIAQGGKDDLERFSKTLNLPERGKVYIKGIFEGDESEVSSISQQSVSEKADKAISSESGSSVSP